MVDEIRPCKPWFYFLSGDRIEEHSKIWAAEIADLVKQYGGGNMRLALDRCNREGIVALESHGLEIHNGEMVM
ncbi:MAG: aminopeptidase P family protein, partial [Bacteroidota bacterium]